MPVGKITSRGRGNSERRRAVICDLPQHPDKKILSESETEKSDRANLSAEASAKVKGANGVVGTRRAKLDARKSDGGMKEKEKEQRLFFCDNI